MILSLKRLVIGSDSETAQCLNIRGLMPSYPWVLVGYYKDHPKCLHRLIDSWDWGEGILWTGGISVNPGKYRIEKVIKYFSFLMGS